VESVLINANVASVLTVVGLKSVVTNVDAVIVKSVAVLKYVHISANVAFAGTAVDPKFVPTNAY
jgi:hypothetical protein